MKNTILKKWRKNLGLAIFISILAIFISILAFILCAIFISLYIEARNNVYLIIFLALIVLITIVYVTSLNTWNEFLYMNEEKIWAKRKGKILEWRFEEITSCKIICWPLWSRRFYYGCEIICSSQSTKLTFESNIRIEKLLLEITKGKEVSKVFNKVFK